MIEQLVQVGLCGRLGVNCVCEDCRAEDAEHVNERPFRVPLAETPARGLRRGQFGAIGDIPQADHTLH